MTNIVVQPEVIKALADCIVDVIQNKIDWQAVAEKAVKRPQGEWIIDNWGIYHCNYCMREKQQLFNNFCGYCGTEMNNEKEKDNG